jgi:uncharacterized protein (TIGR00255 family)
MKSMTGYACIETNVDGMLTVLEIKGYNNRYLEVNISLPQEFSKYECDARRLITDCVKRGKIDFNIRVKDEEKNLNISVSEAAIAAYIAAGEKIVDAVASRRVGDISTVGEANTFQIENKISVHEFLSLRGVLEVENSVALGEKKEQWEKLKPYITELLKTFNTEREREGLHTEKNILSYVAVLENAVTKITQYAPQLEQMIKENIKNRFYELKLDGLDENRILGETALLLMKYTISEELSRLDSHLSEFKAEIERNESPGKKLDFLSQEINREINTIGAKSPMVEVGSLVVEMKDANENIREQLRNVE